VIALYSHGSFTAIPSLASVHLARNRLGLLPNPAVSEGAPRHAPIVRPVASGEIGCLDNLLSAMVSHRDAESQAGPSGLFTPPRSPRQAVLRWHRQGRTKEVPAQEDGYGPYSHVHTVYRRGAAA